MEFDLVKAIMYAAKRKHERFVFCPLLMAFINEMLDARLHLMLGVPQRDTASGK
jgi:hypothetical protein